MFSVCVNLSSTELNLASSDPRFSVSFTQLKECTGLLLRFPFLYNQIDNKLRLFYSSFYFFSYLSEILILFTWFQSFIKNHCFIFFKLKYIIRENKSVPFDSQVSQKLKFTHASYGLLCKSVRPYITTRLALLCVCIFSL